MANAFGHTIWKLDTAGTITTDRVRIRRMEYIPNTAGDDLLVADSNSEDVWRVTDALVGGIAGKEFIEFGEKGYDALGFVLTISVGGLLNVWLA